MLTTANKQVYAYPTVAKSTVWIGVQEHTAQATVSEDTVFLCLQHSAIVMMGYVGASKDALITCVQYANPAYPITHRLASSGDRFNYLHTESIMTNLSPAVSAIPAVISHQNRPVITTALLAGLYESDVKNIQNNFLRNTDRFVEDKHYFKLEGSELKTFKNQPSLRGLVAKNASHLILWTERGAARHAKMLDTDQAWEVFEKLEDSYFITTTQPKLTDHITAEQAGMLYNIVHTRAEHDHKLIPQMWSRLKHHYGYVASYRELKACHFDDAVKYLEEMELKPKAIQSTTPFNVLPVGRWLVINDGTNIKTIDATGKNLVDHNHVSKVTRDLIKFYRATIEMSNRLQVLTGTGSVDVLDNSLTIEWSK